MYLIPVAPAPPALVTFCYNCTCSTVMGPINLLRFLAPFCQFFAVYMVHLRCYDYQIVLKLMAQSCHADCVVVSCCIGNVILTDSGAVGCIGVGVMAALGSQFGYLLSKM